MKINHFVIAIIMIFGGCGAASFAAETNLIENGSFEYGTFPAAAYHSTLSISSGYYRSGNHSCMVKQTEDDGAVLWAVNLEKDKVYSYSVWVRFDPTSTGGESICLAYSGANGYQKKLLAVSGEQSRMDDWECIKGTFRLWEDLESEFIWVFANPQENGLQTFYVDKVEVFETDNRTASLLEAGEVGIYKDYGSGSQTELTKLQSGNLTAVLRGVINHSESTKEIVLIAALYDGRRMVDAGMRKITLDSGASFSQPIALQMDVLDIDQGDYSMKVYLWEEWNTMKPIMKALRITE